MKIIAHIKNDFTSKFGIPRQSGLVPEMMSQIIFEPEFRNPDAIRGLEDFSHLWLIWNFSQSKPTESLTVRPPRLGGNTRVGVFATRSPFQTQSDRSVMCKNRKNRNRRRPRSRNQRFICRFNGWYADIRYKALYSVCGLHTERGGRLCG